MARVLKREAAKRDLIAQWVWYAENAGIEIADRFLDAVEATLISLAAHPESGARTYDEDGASGNAPISGHGRV